MAQIAPPINVGPCFKIGPDGTLVPIASEIGNAGPGAFGNGTVVLTNWDPNQGIGLAIQTIYTAVGFPLPWARYQLDWNAVKTAAASGTKIVANTF